MNRSEVARMFGLQATTLRRLELSGIIPRISDCGSDGYCKAVKLWMAARRLAESREIRDAWHAVEVVN